MERRQLTPEEKLRKITEQLVEAESDTISVRKLKEIIGIETSARKNVSKPFMPGTVYKEFHRSSEYTENYIG